MGVELWPTMSQQVRAEERAEERATEPPMKADER